MEITNAPKMSMMRNPATTMSVSLPILSCARFRPHTAACDRTAVAGGRRTPGIELTGNLEVSAMDPVTMLLRSHAIGHDLGVGEAEGEFSLGHSRLRGLTDDQLRLRPEGWNSIAYLYWHMARTEDVAVNVVVALRPQVFDEEEWAARLKVARRDIGTGMSEDEVEALSRAIDLAALRTYRDAVGRRTQAIARELPPAEWDRTVDAATVQAAIAQGAFVPQAMWVAEFWTGKSTAWFFSWVAVGHNMMHLGQAAWVKEMILRKRGR